MSSIPIPFPFQQGIIDAGRSHLATKTRVCFQSATGSGKTVIACEIIRLCMRKDLRVWFIAPRNKLIHQASKTLSSFGIPHGQISAGLTESNLYRVHVVSKDTLSRRYSKVINPPDVIIFDECHIALDKQIEIYLFLLSLTHRTLYCLGFTATPERLDGRGLSELYQKLVEGPRPYQLVEMGFLSNLDFYSPDLEGIEELHRKGTEVDASELDKLFDERAVYGGAVDLYLQHRPGKQAIIFLPSIKLAKKSAAEFRNRDCNFEAVDGSMSKKMLRDMFLAFEKKEITGFVSCDLLTYGVDLPAIEYIGLMRRTFSRALYLQMVGRGLRVAEGKDACVVGDQANNFSIHGHPLDPYSWNFEGRKKKVPKSDPEKRLMLCPKLNMMYCIKPSCVGCEHNDENKSDVRSVKDLETIDADFKKIEPKVRFRDRNDSEKREINIRISMAVSAFKACDHFSISKPVSDLLKIAEELGRQPMWVYWQLSKERISVNVPLLHEIARQKKYKPQWAYFKGKQIDDQLSANGFRRQKF